MVNYIVIEYSRTWILTRKSQWVRRWLRTQSVYFETKREALTFVRGMLISPSQKYAIVHLDKPKGGRKHGKR